MAIMDSMEGKYTSPLDLNLRGLDIIAGLIRPQSNELTGSIARSYTDYRTIRRQITIKLEIRRWCGKEPPQSRVAFEGNRSETVDMLKKLV